MDREDRIREKIAQLESKYETMGQDMESHLEGLLYTDYLGYWDYVQTDVLLDLQKPKTNIPDESIFIMYHQITELYFKLILHATKQICEVEDVSLVEMKTQLKRINSYWSNLVHSFEIMIDGMDKDQFRKFRMALLPASGFQSAQYRIIEICATDLKNLVAFNKREELSENSTLQELMALLYWRQGATELATQKKTLTLKRFEEKYAREFSYYAKQYEDSNILKSYYKLTKEEQADEELINLMRSMDHNANVDWPTMHLRAAAAYLKKNPEDIKATGGTNWQKYLPPVNQRITFFPELWDEESLATWGKRMQHE